MQKILTTAGHVLNKACDVWVNPAIQTAILIFFTILADRHYVALGHYQLGDIVVFLPVYFLVVRPVLKRKGLV